MIEMGTALEPLSPWGPGFPSLYFMIPDIINYLQKSKEKIFSHCRLDFENDNILPPPPTQKIHTTEALIISFFIQQNLKSEEK